MLFFGEVWFELRSNPSGGGAMPSLQKNHYPDDQKHIYLVTPLISGSRG